MITAEAERGSRPALDGPLPPVEVPHLSETSLSHVGDETVLAGAGNSLVGIAVESPASNLTATMTSTPPTTASGGPKVNASTSTTDDNLAVHLSDLGFIVGDVHPITVDEFMQVEDVRTFLRIP